MSVIDEHVASRPADFVLRAADPSSVVDFYTALFSWQVDAQNWFILDGRRVARAAVGGGGWLPYLAVGDLDVALTAVRAAGGTVYGAAFEGSVHSAVVVEPGGTQLGLWQIGSGPGIETMGEPGTVVWVEEKTHQQTTDAAFLAAMFGFDLVGPEGPGKVRVLRGDGPLFGGVMQFDARWAPDEAPHWLLYFAVADVEAAPTRAQQLGGTVWFPPFDTPLGRMAYLRDPAGNAFAVVTLSAQGRAMTGGTE